MLAFGWALYALGAASAAWIVWLDVEADTSLARIEAPAAPALELAPGSYALEPASSARVFALATREPLDLRTTEAGATFEVPGRGVYVVELLTPGEQVAVRQRQALRVSPTVLVAAAAAPLATLPGTFLLASRGAPQRVRVVLGGSPYNVASVRRRLAGVVLDLLSVGALMVFLLLLGPLFPPVTPLFPFAPFLYLWSGNVRGRTLGRWLSGTRVVGGDGRQLGIIDGLIRTLGGGAGWVLGGAGYAFATLHPSRRAPHDLLSRSYVVYD